MDNDVHASPVSRLLELGKPIYSPDLSWPDYLSFGIGPEHIAALVEIATDLNLIQLPDERDARGWAPIHAWRALGQLHAQEAIEPLMRLFHEVPDNDWVIEEMPDVFAMIGPAAFIALATYLKDGSRPSYSRMVAATSLMEMARTHPQVRSSSVAALTGELLNFKSNSPGMNGVLIANLVELQAVEQADLIHKVFSDGKVDRFIVGDWRDIKQRLRPPALGRSASQPGTPAFQEPHTTPRSTKKI
jgi:hypothetical protein